MKILVNGRFLCRQPTGVDRYASEILRVFDRWYARSDAILNNIEFEIAVPSFHFAHWQPEAIPVRVITPAQGHIWEQMSLARYCHGDDVLLSLCNTGPLVARRHIVAIHDATPGRMPESFSRAFRAYYRFMMPVLGRTAQKIITVSEFSRVEISSCYGIDINKITVLGNSAEHILRIQSDYSILDRLNLRENNYVLAVATSARHKNLPMLADIAARLGGSDYRMVLVGGANQRVFDRLSDPETKDRLLRTGYVSDGKLRALYENATCFVFASLYEGFGMPPLEAMQVGCPVVSSNAASMPEVLGDAALFAEPDDPDAFCQAIYRVAQDPNLRKSLTSKGYHQAAGYSWEDCAKSLLTLCQKL